MPKEQNEKLPKPIKDIKEKAPESKGRTVRQLRIEASYSGPLPRPSDLQEYERVMPGAANRILTMAERQANHRQTLEKTVIVGDSKRANCGLWIGAFVVLCLLGGSVFLIINDHDWAGTVIAGLDIVSLVGVFVYGSNNRRQERIKKTEIMHNLDDTEES